MRQGNGGRRRGVTRDDMLDVAKLHAVRHGWRGTRVQEVAAEAGVSRPTLYKEFPSKHDLGVALWRREISVFMADLQAVVADAPPTVHGILGAGTMFAFEEAERGPFLAAVLTEDRSTEGNLLPNLTQGGDVGGVPDVARGVATILVHALPEEDPHDLEFLAQVAVRLSVSYMVDPGSEGKVETSARIARLCASYVGEPLPAAVTPD